MSNYAESKKTIEAIRNKYGEVIFRMAISHLMDVGLRHLTKENVEDTCKEIMASDDSGRFMSNEFECEIVQTAYDLALVSHIDLLVYIQREVAYDVHDETPSYGRAMHLLKKCMEQIEANECYDNTVTLEVFEELGFADDELYAFGFEYLIRED